MRFAFVHPEKRHLKKRQRTAHCGHEERKMAAAAPRSRLASPEQWCEYERLCRLMLGPWTWMLPVATHGAIAGKYLSPEEAETGARVQSNGID